MSYCKLLKAQQEFLNIPHKYALDVALYQGGYGSGKTFSGSLLGIMLCLKYPGIRGLVGRRANRGKMASCDSTSQQTGTGSKERDRGQPVSGDCRGGLQFGGAQFCLLAYQPRPA